MGTLNTYILGFVLSLLCTFVAFSTVVKHVQGGHVFPAHEVMVPLLVALALAQLVVQLICFLHLGKETKPRWNLIVFSFALLIVTIVVGGSLWIMSHLMHEQMSSAEILEDESFVPPAQ